MYINTAYVDEGVEVQLHSLLTYVWVVIFMLQPL
jgi:hypothetical protein